MVKVSSHFKGLEGVESKLDEATKGILKNNAEGITLAGEFVKGESQLLTSIKEGNLIRTAFSKSTGDDKKPGATIGYTADYAGAVHEMPDDTKWNRPGAENEFLEKAVIRNLSKIVNLIARIAGRKPT